MTDPTDSPRRSGRHSGEEGGRSAADFLASWHTGEFPAISDEPTGPVTDGPRRARRLAAEEAEVAREAAAREPRAGRPSTPLPSRPTSRPLDPADEQATRRTPLIAPGTTEMPVRPGLAPRPPASALAGLILGNTGRTPRVVAETTPPTRTPPVSQTPASRPPVSQQPAVSQSWDDDEPTDRHGRVRAASPAAGPVLYDQEQDVVPTAAEPQHDAPHHGAPHHGDQPLDDQPLDDRHADDQHADDHPIAAHPVDDHPAAAHTGAGTAEPVHPVWDQTGGLDVIGADAEEERGRRGRRNRGGRSTGKRERRARRPITIVVSLVVLVGLVAGIVVGGQWLIAKINPVAEDYTGQGTGEVQIRVETGDSLTAIGSTLVEADVIASSGPFVDAASANPAATGIQPGVYGMRLQMSGQAALDLLLDPAARLFARVTVREGLRVDQVLQAVADGSQIPLADLQAAAADPAALGLPAWANGLLEGHLFPATYDIEPGQTAVDVLAMMVTRAEQTFDSLQIPEGERLRVLTEASLVQAEAATTEDMAMVATVIDNRVAAGMPLQFDTTVNFATGLAGITTTATDRAIDSPYNTYLYPGLPPGAIDSPGEEALQAVLSPTPGTWLYFVVVDPDTGDTRFATTFEEHQANVALFQQWLRDNPGG